MKVTPKQLAQTLYELTDGKSGSEAEKSVADFALYMYRERKLKLADKIIEQFGRIYNKNNGIAEASIATRNKISEAELGKVKSYIKKKYGAKEVVLKNTVDESIKGGIIIRVGDEIVDGSIAGRLGELKKVLAS